MPVNVVFGLKKLETIGKHAITYEKKALIVTTGSFFKESGLVDRIAGYLKNEGKA